MANGIVRYRKNIENFTAQELSDLRDAYQKMQAIAGTDNRSWIYWAEFHGFNGYDCWHHSRTGPGPTTFPYNLFLPWHRAYLMYWEHVALDQNANFVFPWWDWTSTQSHATGIPPAFSDPNVNGNPNPLAVGPKPAMDGLPAGPTSRNPGTPDGLPSDTDVSQVLALTEFTDFQAQLEDIHDQVHGWVGGDMGNISAAAFDPIFWSHHSNIDRLWYVWQNQNGNGNLPPDYLARVLVPWAYTVQDVLSISALGYDYAEGVVSVNV